MGFSIFNYLTIAYTLCRLILGIILREFLKTVSNIYDSNLKGNKVSKNLKGINTKYSTSVRAITLIYCHKYLQFTMKQILSSNQNRITENLLQKFPFLMIFMPVFLGTDLNDQYSYLRETGK